MRVLFTAVCAIAVACGLVLCGCGSSDTGRRGDITPGKGAWKHDIQKLAKEEGVAGLKALLEEYSDPKRYPNRRMNIINALGTFKGDREAAEILLKVIETGSENDQYFAIGALARTGAPESKDVIERVMKGSKPRLREAACFAIAEYGDRSLYPLLRRAVEDENAAVRGAARVVMDKYGID